MPQIYKSQEGERLVRERYLTFLKYWPTANEQMRVPTREGETFVVACGDPSAPPLLLLHGSAGNSAMWMGDVAAWAAHFRVYAIDVIGEPGLSAPSRPALSSDGHALWLDDVMRELSLSSSSLVGVSLGGWLALDYAVRRPERVDSLVVISPAGIGRQKVGMLLKVIALKMCGKWGTQRLREMILGRSSSEAPPALRKFMEFVALIHEHFRPRMDKIPVLSDAALKGMRVPILAILGGKDALLDSDETKRRLVRHVLHAEILYLPDAGHNVPKQTASVGKFLATSRRTTPGTNHPEGHLPNTK